MSYPANQPFKVKWTYDPAYLKYVSRFEVHYGSLSNRDVSGIIQVQPSALECLMPGFAQDTYAFSVMAIPTAAAVQQSTISDALVAEFVASGPTPDPVPAPAPAPLPITIPKPGAPTIEQV